MTLREYPQVGMFVVRILEDERSKARYLDIREYRFSERLTKNGFRIRRRTEVTLLHDVLGAVLRDPLF